MIVAKMLVCEYFKKRKALLKCKCSKMPTCTCNQQHAQHDFAYMVMHGGLNGCFCGHWAISSKYLAKKLNKMQLIGAFLFIDEFYKDYNLEMLVLAAENGKT